MDIPDFPTEHNAVVEALKHENYTFPGNHQFIQFVWHTYHFHKNLIILT